MIYFDNASSTRKKPFCVLHTIRHAIRHDLSNPGRSGHKYALHTMEKIYDTRCVVADHLGCDPLNVIFTPSCTHALNLAIRGTIRHGGHIIATCFEHNSVLRTLEYLRNLGEITYDIIYPKDKHHIGVEDIARFRKANTYLVIVNQTSNVTGDTQDIKSIANYCKEEGLLLLVDMAQSGGHEVIDMADGVNMVALAGHKGFFALQCGVLACRDITPDPLIFGGTGTMSESLVQPKDLPEGLESGTLPVANILSLGEGIKYASKHSRRINRKIEKMSKILIDTLSKTDNVKLYSNNTKSGVILFNIADLDCGLVADILSNKYHVCARSGLHCAPLAHKNIGTEKTGAVRLSLSGLNHIYEAYYVARAIENIASDRSKYQ